jgi:hypothetical protein
VTRDEHLAWAKERTLEYVEAGELANAVASMGSDLRKHPDFQKPVYSTLMLLGLYEIERGRDAVRRWVEGFN